MHRSTAMMNDNTSPSSADGGTGGLSIGASSSERRAQRLAELADRSKFDDSDMKINKPTLSSTSEISSSTTLGTGRYTSLATSPGSSPYHPKSYRFAGLDRLGQRNKIYNTGTTTTTSGGDVNSSTGSNQNLVSTSADVSPIGRLTSSISSLTSPAGRLGSTSSITSPGGYSPRTTGVGTYSSDRENRVPSTMGVTPNLSSKRELFFRQDGPPSSTTAATAPTSTNATNGSVTSSSTTNTSSLSNSRENILSSSNKDKENSSLRQRDTTSASREKESSSHYSSTKSVDGYVGFANLPNQVYRKAVKKGFDFTLMVVGESGLGKSTLINSMFLTDIYAPDYPGPSMRIKKTVQVETTKILLKENGVNLTLTVVDTPGFGDAVDNSNCWQPIIDFIENKYEDYLNCESRVNRKVITDNRVHSCLYFIAPSGHGLKPLDIEFMKRLHDKVNIIPLIAKADTMTPEECTLFKKTILNEIAQHKIKIYEFPDCDDEEDNKVQKPLKERVPFAVVGSNTIIDNNGKKIRGRKYPWGVVEVENLEHCDFIALRNMLIRTHMQDLKDVANSVHYENYRCRKLAGVSQDGKQSRLSNKNPLAQMEDEKKEHEDKIKRMEQDMENVFEMKVKEKKQKLKDSEADLQKRHEQMKKSLEQQQKELEDKKKGFAKEKETFEIANKDLEEIYRKNTLENSKDMDGKEKKKEKKKGLF